MKPKTTKLKGVASKKKVVKQHHFPSHISIQGLLAVLAGAGAGYIGFAGLSGVLIAAGAILVLVDLGS